MAVSLLTQLVVRFVRHFKIPVASRRHHLSFLEPQQRVFILSECPLQHYLPRHLYTYGRNLNSFQETSRIFARLLVRPAFMPGCRSLPPLWCTFCSGQKSKEVDMLA
ncbi:hypothetical protein J6590_086568 [Homalodisca vitripennis]|nr:hypothetical protein J6590_086568 [Homalodisca vitripennis]